MESKSGGMMVPSGESGNEVPTAYPSISISSNKIAENSVTNGDFVIGFQYKVERPIPNPERLMALVHAIEQLPENSEQFKDHLAEYESFMRPRPHRDIVGLEAKLENGERGDLLQTAEFLKHKFAVRASKEQLSRSSRMVYLHIMSRANSIFDQKILPLIKDKHSRVIVDHAVMDHLIEPLEAEVSANDASVTSEFVRGAIYFLTGNCHIKWS